MTEKQWNNSIQRGGTMKFIAPSGKWQCFCCLQPYRQLEVLQETALDIFLICAPCMKQTERAQTEQRNLFDSTDKAKRKDSNY